MFSTDKEVHIYIDGAIQLLSSNRKQSIAPQHIDMILNNSASEYVSSKFPTNNNPKDIEQTLKRYTEFSSLKVSKSFIPYFSEDSDCRVVKPFNAIKIQAVRCSYFKVSETVTKTMSNMYVGLLSINDDLVSEENAVLTISYTEPDNPNVVTENISLDVFISNVKTKAGMFYVYNMIVETLRRRFGFNVSYSSSDKFGRRLIKIHMPIGYSIVDLKCSSSTIMCSIETSQKTHIVPGYGVNSPVDIVSELDSSKILSDHYASVDLHRNPICTISSDEIIVPLTNFLPYKIHVSYIKRPDLFDINTNTIPDMELTKDFLDYAVKQIHLITNSPNYEKVLNESLRTQ